MSPTLRFELICPAADADRLVAELWSLHTLGVEEQPDRLVAWFPPACDVEAVRALASDPQKGAGVAVRGPEWVADEDWEQRWREGLEPRRVGPLWIRPSWCPSEGTPELVIDPRQAFGTGEHATTRLALELLLEELRPGDDVLDVGTGTGILGLAALVRGAACVVGLDVDPVACANARDNADTNGLPLRVLCGTAEALAPQARFDVVVANVLFARIRDTLPDLARRAKRALIVAGQIEREQAALVRIASRHGFVLGETRFEEQGGLRWAGSAFRVP